MLRRLSVLTVTLTLCTSSAFAHRGRVIIRPSHRVRVMSPRRGVVSPIARRRVAALHISREAADFVGTRSVTPPFFFAPTAIVTVPRYVYVPTPVVVNSPVTTWATGSVA